VSVTEGIFFFLLNIEIYLCLVIGNKLAEVGMLLTCFWRGFMWNQVEHRLPWQVFSVFSQALHTFTALV
jgi:hypothetical protein